jgi:hypothetical protein
MDGDKTINLKIEGIEKDIRQTNDRLDRIEKRLDKRLDTIEGRVWFIVASLCIGFIIVMFEHILF